MKDARAVCIGALERTEAHMLLVAEQIAESTCERHTAELSERLNTIDNGRIVLKQMVDQQRTQGPI